MGYGLKDFENAAVQRTIARAALRLAASIWAGGYGIGGRGAGGWGLMAGGFMAGGRLGVGLAIVGETVWELCCRDKRDTAPYR